MFWLDFEGLYVALQPFDLEGFKVTNFKDLFNIGVEPVAQVGCRPFNVIIYFHSNTGL